MCTSTANEYYFVCFKVWDKTISEDGGMQEEILPREGQQDPDFVTLRQGIRRQTVYSTFKAKKEALKNIPHIIPLMNTGKGKGDF